jgi:tetratricopeptide (TPR) repeat protein
MIGAPVVLCAMLLLAPAGRAGQPRASTSPTTVTQELDRAASALAAGRRAEAAALYRTIAARQGSVRALLQLARIQSGDGDAAGALESLAKARTLAPNAEDVLSAYAQVALASRALVPAIVTLDALTRMCPDVMQHQYLLGIALMQAGDMPNAIEALKRAEELEPDRPRTLTALGLAFNNRKMYADAAPPLQRALELDPDSVEATAALAEAEQGLGQVERAEARVGRVLAKAPGNATANFVMGMALMRTERFAGARDAFLRASAADPLSPKPDYQLSLAYARLGDDANADKYLRQYRKKLQDIERWLGELRAQMGVGTTGGMK